MSLTLYERIIGFYDVSDDELTESYSLLDFKTIENFFRKKKVEKKENPTFFFEAFKDNYFIREYVKRNVKNNNGEKSPFSKIILDYLSSSEEELKKHFKDFKELFPLESVVEQAVLKGKFNYNTITNNSFKSKAYSVLETISEYFLPASLGFLFYYFSLSKGFDLFSLQTSISFPLGFFLGRELFIEINNTISDFFLLNNPNYFFVGKNFIELNPSLDLILYYSTIIESLLF